MTKGTNYINNFKKAGLFIALIFALFSYGNVAGAASVPVVISNERIERVGGNTTVYWSTNIPATGRVVYGTESVPKTLPLQFEGYEKGTPQTHAPLVFEHSITFVGIEDIQNYFFRPVSKAGDQMAIGRELSLYGIAVPTGGTVLPVQNTNVVSGQGCSYLSSYLHKNGNNNSQEVIKLQQFLNQYSGEKLPVTGVFGDETFSAVVRFQEKYAGDILRPWGYNSGTGYVYILTQKKINEISCNTFFPLTPSQLNEIGDFNIQHSASAPVVTTTVSTSAVASPTNTTVEGQVVIPITTTTKPVIMPLKDTSTTSSSVEPVSALPTTSVANAISSGIQSEGTTKVAMIGDVDQSNSGSLFSLIVTTPKSSSDLLKVALNFIFILVLIYIASNILAHTNDRAVSMRTIRSRKLMFYTLGTFLAFIISLVLKFYTLTLPLAIMVLPLAIIWFLYVRGEDRTNIIVLPGASDQRSV